MSQIGAELPAKLASDEPSTGCGIAKRSALVKRARGQERTICGMWHRKTIRPSGASGWSGTNHLRMVASQDGPPRWSEQPIRNESPAEYGLAKRSALAE